MDPEQANHPARDAHVGAEDETDYQEPHDFKPEDIEEEYTLEGGDEPMDDDSDNEDAGAEGSAQAVGGSGDPNAMQVGAGGEEEEGMEQLEDTSIAAFYEHRKSVFTVELHPAFPSPPLAISGGEDDAGWIWSTHDGAPVAKLDGHTDSVVAAGFSFTGEYAATGGMDGQVRIWRRRGEPNNWTNWEFLISLEGPDEVVVGVAGRDGLTSCYKAI